jgi:hypothetical protein
MSTASVPQTPLRAGGSSGSGSIGGSAAGDGMFFGDTIQLLARSSYSKEYSTVIANSADIGNRPLEPIGFYAKNGRYGTLVAVPPIGAAGSPHFRPSTFTVTSIVADDSEVLTRQRLSELPLNYGDVFVLVDDQGCVWNNRLGIAAGYVGPRPRGWTGEMTVSFSHASKRAGEPVLYGDVLFIDVQDSFRSRTTSTKRITNFKKSSSKLVGGYLVSDGSGIALSFVPRFLSGRGLHEEAAAGAAEQRSVFTPQRNTPSPQGVRGSPLGRPSQPASEAAAASAANAAAGPRRGLPSRHTSVSVDESDAILTNVVVHWADGGDDTLPAQWGKSVTLGEVGVEDSVTINVKAGARDIEHKVYCPPPKIDTEEDEPTDTIVRSIVNLAKYGVQNLQLEIIWGSIGAPKTIKRMMKSSLSLSRVSLRSRASMRSRGRSARRPRALGQEAVGSAGSAGSTGNAASPPEKPKTEADYEKRFMFALFLFAITGISAGVQFRWTNSLILAAATAVFGMLCSILIIFFAPFKKSAAAVSGKGATNGSTLAVSKATEDDEVC